MLARHLELLLAKLTVEPRLLPSLLRDVTAIKAGQYWRLVTSLVVQDGGWAGAVLDFAGLLEIGVVAERTLGQLQWSTARVISVAASSQMLAHFWQPRGVGNSVLSFGLAGAVCAVS